TASVARVALARGATRAAAAVVALFEHGRVAPEALDAGTLAVLVERGVLAGRSGRVTPAFEAAVSAWRGVLEGTAADLSGCGSLTLDVWAAEVLSALLNAPASQAELRRDLRRQGVAAFGLLA